jgi:hypothetical protein
MSKITQQRLYCETNLRINEYQRRFYNVGSNSEMPVENVLSLSGSRKRDCTVRLKEYQWKMYFISDNDVRMNEQQWRSNRECTVFL